MPDPKILNARDAIVRITSTAICGSDLHLYNGFMPTMEKGDILGHEFMGEVVEVGPAVKNLKVGDRVVVPFPIACGNCCAVPARSCTRSARTPTRTPGWPRSCWGHSPAGIFGYSHMLGGYAGRPGRVRARAVRRRRAAQGRRTTCPTSRCCSCPTSSRPATWAPRCATSSRATSSPSGAAGPVGQFAIASAYLLGAERVIAIDRFPYRLRMARERGRRRDDQLRGGRRLRSAEGDDRRPRARTRASTRSAWRRTATGRMYAYDRAKQAMRLETDRPHRAARGDPWPAATAGPSR